MKWKLKELEIRGTPTKAKHVDLLQDINEIMHDDTCLVAP